MASSLKPELPPLFPPGFHELDLAAVRKSCVRDQRFILSISRQAVFEGLVQIVEVLSKAKISGELWIDGSFVTTKINPHDVDLLLRVSSDLYDNDPDKRNLIDWASSAERLDSHSCDAYRWVEYSVGHPLFAESDADRAYWTDWFGHSRPPKKTPKGIVVIRLPAKLK